MPETGVQGQVFCESRPFLPYDHYIYPCKCTCVLCVFMFRCTHKHASLYVEAKGDPWVSFLKLCAPLFFFFLRQNLLLWPRNCLFSYTGYPANLRDPSASTTPMFESQELTQMPSFLQGFWGPNSGPDACTEST